MLIPWDQHAPSEHFDLFHQMLWRKAAAWFQASVPAGPAAHPTDSQDRSHRIWGFSTLPTDSLNLQPKSLVCTAKTTRIPVARAEGPRAASMLFWKQVEGNVPSMRNCKCLCQHTAISFFLISHRPDTLNAIWLCTTRCSHHWVWVGRYKYIKFIGGNRHPIYKRLQVSCKMQERDTHGPVQPKSNWAGFLFNTHQANKDDIKKKERITQNCLFNKP